MSVDIVAALRRTGGMSHLHTDAADEIERLRHEWDISTAACRMASEACTEALERVQEALARINQLETELAYYRERECRHY